MLVPAKELLQDARKKAYAVGAFNVPSLEAVRAVIGAAEEGGHPVILQHAEVHESYVPLDLIGPVMLAAARGSSVPTAVHLDHGESFDMCVRAMNMGFSSVMYDASAKPFETNSRETAEIVKIARVLGVSVEAEIGRMLTSAVGGGEGRGPLSDDDYEDPGDCYTDPDDARRFVDVTGVDALAVAFGTVHGVYMKKPALNIDRVAEIRKRTDVPLVMHGGSGVSEKDFRAAIRNGITKINYYTYMAMAGGEAVDVFVRRQNDSNEKIFFHDITKTAVTAMKENALAAMNAFSMR